MIAFLLLRDNKQSGPYSLDELLEKGIRVNDLIWIEGKSTSWQYTDEIEELRSFVSPAPSIAYQASPSHGRSGQEIKHEGGTVIWPLSKEKGEEPSSKETMINPLVSKTQKDPIQKKVLETRKTLFTKKDQIPAAEPLLTGRPDQERVAPSLHPIKVIIADDHTLFREGVKMALSQKKDIRILAEAANGQQLLHELKHNRPDVILLDIQMPVMDGISALTAIRKVQDEVKVIILSMHEGHSMVSTLMEAGANGYLSKTSDPETIYQAIKTTFEKNYYFNELTNVSMLEKLRSKKPIPEKIITTSFDGDNLMRKLTEAKKISARQSPEKIKRRLLVAACLVLMVCAGIAGVMRIHGNSPLLTDQVPASSSQAASLTGAPPRLTDSASQRKKTDTAAINRIDSLSLKNQLAATGPVSDKRKDQAMVRKINSGSGKDSLNHMGAIALEHADSNALGDSKAVSSHIVPVEDGLKTRTKMNIRNLVTATLLDFHKGALGGLSDIQIQVSNSSAYPVEEVDLEVQYLLSNGKLYKTENMVFQNILSGNSVQLQAPKSSRGVRIEYHILSIKSKELNL